MEYGVKTLKPNPSLEEILDFLGNQTLFDIKREEVDLLIERITKLSRSSREFRADLVRIFEVVLNETATDDDITQFFVKYGTKLMILDLEKIQKIFMPNVAAEIPGVNFFLFIKFALPMMIAFFAILLIKIVLRRDSGMGIEVINGGPFAKESLSLKSLQYIIQMLFILNKQKAKNVGSELEDVSLEEAPVIIDEFLSKTDQTES